MVIFYLLHCHLFAESNRLKFSLLTLPSLENLTFSPTIYSIIENLEPLFYFPEIDV